jgi:hypothetical protein
MDPVVECPWTKGCARRLEKAYEWLMFAVILEKCKALAWFI